VEQTTTTYLHEVKARLVSSTAVHSFQILKERITPVNGYLRVRITLHNGDLLEAAEYFEQGVEGPTSVDYRYHWMDKEQRLRRSGTRRCRPPNSSGHITGAGKLSSG